jgi:hypothetical protein
MSIYTKQGHEIPEFDKNLDHFLNRSVILYGASNSGKSTVIRDILYMLKNHIPNVCVICPTNDLNGSYDHFIPKPLIHTEVSETLLDDILKRQSLSVKLFNMSNDLSKLRHIYSVLQKKDDQELERMENAYCSVKSRVTDTRSLDEAHAANLVAFYKKIITKNIKYVDSLPLQETDKLLVKHININPNFLIIIDDAAVTANKWCKFNSTKELFFNGRHHRITFMIAFQDDKPLDSMLRKNAFINVFTTEQVCNTFFNRGANNFTKRERDIAEASSSKIFGDTSNKHRKLVYLRGAEKPFNYYTADLVPDFVFGSAYLIKYCEQVSRNDSQFDMFDFEKFF